MVRKKSSIEGISGGGVKALVVLSGLALLPLYYYSGTACVCGVVASLGLSFLPRVYGIGFRANTSFGLVVGLPVLVGFIIHPGVFFGAVFFSWSVLRGLDRIQAWKRTSEESEDEP